MYHMANDIVNNVHRAVKATLMMLRPARGGRKLRAWNRDFPVLARRPHARPALQDSSVPGLPRFNEDTTLSIDGLKAALQLDHALDLLGERQVGKVATSLFLGVLLFRKRAHSCHVDSSLPGQTRPCAAQISANLF